MPQLTIVLAALCAASFGCSTAKPGPEPPTTLRPQVAVEAELTEEESIARLAQDGCACTQPKCSLSAEEKWSAMQKRLHVKYGKEGLPPELRLALRRYGRALEACMKKRPRGDYRTRLATLRARACRCADLACYDTVKQRWRQLERDLEARYPRKSDAPKTLVEAYSKNRRAMRECRKRLRAAAKPQN